MVFSFQRVIAIMRRHFLMTFRTFDKFANVVYWPLINIVIWGLTSTSSSDASSLNLAKILIAISLWQIVLRVMIETAKGILEELLSRNFVNLFSTPLTIGEWMVAIMFLGFINMVILFGTCSIFTYLLYGIHITMLGWQTIPLAFSLLLTGWSIGFIMAGMLIRWGMRVNDFLYVIVWGIAPFSAIYGSITLLPVWAQNIARGLPLMYVFEAMREGVTTGRVNSEYLYISFGLNVAYLLLILWLFLYFFKVSKSKGLARLE